MNVLLPVVVVLQRRRRRCTTVRLLTIFGIVWGFLFAFTWWRVDGITVNNTLLLLHTTTTTTATRTTTTSPPPPPPPPQQQQQQQRMSGNVLQQQYPPPQDTDGSSSSNTTTTKTFESSSSLLSWPFSIQAACALLPGDPSSVEGSPMGYQVLRRIEYGLTTLTTTTSQSKRHRRAVRILCILPFYSSDQQRSVLETYGSECDGILVVIVTQQQQQQHRTKRTVVLPPSWDNTTTNTSHPQPTMHLFEFPDDDMTDPTRTVPIRRKEFVKYLSNLHYDWYHWGSVHYYTVVGLLRAYLEQQPQPQKQAKTLILQPWRLVNASDKKYWGLYGDEDKPAPCFPVSDFHHSALSEFLLDETILRRDTHDNLTQWITHHVGRKRTKQHAHPDTTTCAPVEILTNAKRNYNTAWVFARRYFEIRALRIMDYYRLHAILHNQCPPPVVDALDEQGRPGYIANVTYLRHHPLPFTNLDSICQINPGDGDEGKNGYHGLKKIRIPTLTPKHPRTVLCMVYTHEARHNPYLQSIAQTWGPKCNGFFAASNITDPTLGAVHLIHEGPELYENMWQKIISMWQYAYKYYFDQFDFFHIIGDDTYVIPENLQYTVSTGNWKGPWNQSTPLFLGGSLPLFKQRRYCGGGSGYTLNRPALQLLMNLLHTPRCWPRMKSSDEDRIMASCFRQVHNLQCMDTNDEHNETRYHTWHVDQHASWKPGVPCQDCHDLPLNHGIAWKTGLGQISETSVSFHLKNPKAKSPDRGIQRYHAIVYGLCNNTTKF